MLSFEPKDICELRIINDDDDDELKYILSQDIEGLKILPEKYGEAENLFLMSDAGDFAKWLRKKEPDIEIIFPEKAPKLLLHSADYWLPLVFLGSQITLPVFVNFVSSYLYDKMVGKLNGENSRIRVSAIYGDNGVLKKFNFEGDLNSLETTIEKLKVNSFFNE